MIRKISKDEFVKRYRSPQLGIVEERSWFANDDFSIIGTVVFDLVDKNWSWVILRPDPVKYAAIKVDTDLPTQEAAETAIQAAMAAI